MNNNNKDFKYEIIKNLGVIYNNNNYTLEVNLISYCGNPPKIDIRKWNRNKDTMQKGLTFNDSEVDSLIDILNAYKEGRVTDEQNNQ